MEDDLKISRMDYLSKHGWIHTQIWNLSFGDQSKLFKCFKCRQPPMEDNLKWKRNILSTPGRILLKFET
jgi:hypothetical protein